MKINLLSYQIFSWLVFYLYVLAVSVQSANLFLGEKSVNLRQFIIVLIVMGPRLRWQYCKVIMLTSLAWILADMVLLMYFTECTNTATKPCDKDAKDVPQPPKQGLLDRILPGLGCEYTN